MNPFFWDTTMHHWVIGFRRFEGRWCLYLQASKVARADVSKASRYFERSGTDYQMTQRHLHEKQTAEEALNYTYQSKYNTAQKCASSRCDSDSSTKRLYWDWKCTGWNGARTQHLQILAVIYKTIIRVAPWTFNVIVYVYVTLN
jgi:hypothetical protein